MVNKQLNYYNRHDLVNKPTFAQDLNSFTSIVKMKVQSGYGGATTLCDVKSLQSKDEICYLTNSDWLLPADSSLRSPAVTLCLTTTSVLTVIQQHANRKLMKKEEGNPVQGISSRTISKGKRKKYCCYSRLSFQPLHLNALHRLVDGLQQSPVLRVLVTVFVSKHVGQGIHITVKVLL